MEIRLATPKDAEALLQIYRFYVENTAISFEYIAPTVAEFQNRIAKTLAEYPYLVAVEDDKIIGYAYAGPFRSRAAYKHWSEVSIYIDRNCRGKGTGKALYTALEALLVKQNIYTLCAVITSTDRQDDAHLTDASIHFHTHIGYRLAGKHTDCGYKFGKWYSVCLMEKPIREKELHVEPFIPFSGIL